MLELAKEVLDLTGSKSKIVYKPLPGDDPKMRRPNIDLAKSALGWEPTIPLRQGLEKTIVYFEELLKSEG
jgi:UDP-glucuronate decarboxylase